MDNKKNQFDLNGKNALITGASGLLGAQHAYALLEVGATVILTDIETQKVKELAKSLQLEFGHKKVIAQYMDVSCEKQVQKVSEGLKKNGVRIDILINNAAIDPKASELKDQREQTRLENFSLENWNKEISIGLTGAFLCCKIFGYEMSRDGKGGVILNLASDLSVIAPDQRLYMQENLTEEMQPTKPVTYSVIKTGMVGLTKYLSSYWAGKGIRTNALSPGGVRTDQSPEFIERLENLIPLGRMANVDEYRSVVQFLCSDASAYMNGQNIIMDGGRSVI
jgi:NAD(P)-dependent dehydrogenase (short-subunit alcohol dehydrogenase family)